MGSPQNLSSISEVVSIYKCPRKKIVAALFKFGAQKHEIFDNYFATFALDT